MSMLRGITMPAETETEASGTDFEHLPPVLTVPEMAKLLRIGRGSAYELVRSGGVPSVKVGKLVRIPRDGLILWLSREKPPVHEAA
jgi:excisionase family DNA binding protein